MFALRTAPRRLFLLSVIFSCGGVNLTSAAEERFTLAHTEQVSRSARSVLNRGFASPSQRHMAWLADGNLVIAREPDFQPEVLVSHEERGALSRLSFGGDGSLFFVRAGKGSHAVPELVRLNPDDKSAPEIVASGAALPSGQLFFAPGGQAFAFIDGKLIHEFRRSVDGGWERRPLLDPNDSRHSAAVRITDLTYSPDGTKIAFESWRKAKQKYIAVHDITARTTRFVDPGIYRDDAPAWSPDGTELAFVREPGNWTMNYRFTPMREGAPWSIVAVNVQTGALRTIWKADTGRGSVRTVFDPLPLWIGDRILFTWEKTGWNQLYSVPAAGGEAVLLTPGDGEVDSVALSADGRTLVYTSNVGDLARCHLWSIALSAGEPMQLTSGKGVESRAQFSAGGYLSYVSGNRDKGPPQLLVRTPSGETRATNFLSADAARQNEDVWNQFLAPEIITVKAADGLVSYHVLTKPSAPPPADGYPVIVFAHGGPATQTRPGGGPGYSFGQYAVSQGYLFVDINYRGSTGFGLEYRLPAGAGAMGASELKELQALIRYLARRGDANLRRVGIIGHSYGGHIVGIAMSRLADDFAAGVSLQGVADWNVEMKKDEEVGAEMSEPSNYLRLSKRLRIEDQAYSSSPSAHLASWRGPILFTFGDLDTLGHAESVIDLGYQLLERGVPVEFHADPSGGHGLFPQQKVFEFFEKHLKRAR